MRTGFFSVGGLGMAIFLRVDEAHYRAVQRAAMFGAETVAAKGGKRAAFPERPDADVGTRAMQRGMEGRIS